MKTIKVIVIGNNTLIELVKTSLTKENYGAFPQINEYAVETSSLNGLSEDLKDTVIVIEWANLNGIGVRNAAWRTICIGSRKEKDRIEMAGVLYCDGDFWQTTKMPKLIDKIIAKQDAAR